MQEVHLSENTGCYTVIQTLVNFRSQLGDKLKMYNFSEAQDGEGIQKLSIHTLSINSLI